MESLIPKLFIISIEAAVVFAIIIAVLIFRNLKRAKQDKTVVAQSVKELVENDSNRVKNIQAALNKIDYQGDVNDKANELYSYEKQLIQEMLNAYIKHDPYVIATLPNALFNLNEQFIIPSSPLQDSEKTQAESEEISSEQNSDLKETNEKLQLEINDLRLKNTDLNNQLFTALDTVTNVVTEQSRSQSPDEQPNSQEILDAIMYLRENKDGNPATEQVQPQTEAPVAKKQVASEAVENKDVDSTIFSENSSDMDFSGMLQTDLDSDLSEEVTAEETESTPEANKDDNNAAQNEDDDPWSAALAEQEETEANSSSDDDWGAALAEQADGETGDESSSDDDWGAALAEQADGETGDESSSDDDWGAALAEQADGETGDESSSDDDWGAALAEQADGENSDESSSETDNIEEDPWAEAFAEEAASKED